MAEPVEHLDQLLAEWRFSPGEVRVREAVGADGRGLLLLRIDMGTLLMETDGRPDGDKPEGFDTYHELLESEALLQGDAFTLDEERCREVDREFYQFYHRRIALLSLKRYSEALRDAEHTLGLMDFSTRHAPSPAWAETHEQYRPFVYFHRVQAAALVALEESDAAEAVRVIEEGRRVLQESPPAGNDDDSAAVHAEEIEELRDKLGEMVAAINEHYEVTPSLTDQLAEAIAAEQYERAARIRDRIDQARKT
ncbi:MAG: UvrB/UvrC motif-containing protein [Planctomycetota bacterium]